MTRLMVRTARIPIVRTRLPGGNRGRDPQGQPPDLDELWRDLNRKLGGLFGGRNGGGRGPGNGSGGGFQPDMKNTGVGVGLIAAVAVLIWLGSGFFIVQEGQQAVITQFGKYKTTVNAGFNWRLPYPIQRHELVFVTQIRSADVGRDSIIKSTGLRESAMLTEDENIVEIKFAVQYRLNDARAWLFESRNPGEAVIQVAETAVREIVGKMRMDTALAEERDQIAPRVRTLMQTILDRYKIGVEVVGINLQQGGVRPPEQVQAAFDDVLKAGQERERAKNEAQAYANDVIPRAVGSASRLTEEAAAYKARIVAQAQGMPSASAPCSPSIRRRRRSPATACTSKPCSRSTRTSPRCWWTRARVRTCCISRWTRSCRTFPRAEPPRRPPRKRPRHRRPHPYLPVPPRHSPSIPARATPAAPGTVKPASPRERQS